MIAVKNLSFKLLFTFLFLWSFLVCDAQRYYIHCGSLLDVRKAEVLENMTIVVDGNIIESVENGLKKPGKNDQLIDLTGKTVMPGFIDLHVHIESETSPKRYEEQFRLNDADKAFRSTVYAKKTLMAGFTTVRDLGGTGINIAMRKAIASG